MTTTPSGRRRITDMTQCELISHLTNIINFHTNRDVCLYLEDTVEAVDYYIEEHGIINE